MSCRTPLDRAGAKARPAGHVFEKGYRRWFMTDVTAHLEFSGVPSVRVCGCFATFFTHIGNNHESTLLADQASMQDRQEFLFKAFFIATDRPQTAIPNYSMVR
jgi:hypothetical protein